MIVAKINYKYMMKPIKAVIMRKRIAKAIISLSLFDAIANWPLKAMVTLR